jgi:hypothetical protein
MAKKRITSADLSWLIFERTRDRLGKKRGLPVAVVSDPKLGWRAVVDGRAHSLSLDDQRKLRSIEHELRSTFDLAS